MSTLPKVGLVLSGGGAKGAYQVGVLQALQEMGTQVDMLAGASIGALNGAILAGAATLPEGIARLEKLWNILADTSPIKVNSATYIKMMLGAGSILMPPARILLFALGADSTPILEDGPLTKLMDEYLDTEALAKGLPLYVSVYKSAGSLEDLGRCLVAAAGFKDTPNSEFIHLQSMPESEQKNILLASAALPMLFKAKKINGTKYIDGGLGGRSKMQGNTPIKPLIDAGCKLIIVTHLNDGSLWDRHDFPEATILEIRPQSSIARDKGFLGGAKDLLGFDHTKIPSWIKQGYQDTLHCMGRIKEATDSRNELVISKQVLLESEQRGEQADAVLVKMMVRLQAKKEF